jgi:hypothetical protein
VAKALFEWLPQVINQVEPWMSAKSIESGKISVAQIMDALETTHFGIICVTPENQKETWLNFEAGALAKAVANEGASAIPLLIGFESMSQLTTPLSTLQAHLSSKEDLNTVVHTINKALGSDARQANQLDAAFEKWWPDLEVKLAEAEAWADHALPDEDNAAGMPPAMLEQILESIRSLQLQFTGLAQVRQGTIFSRRDWVSSLSQMLYDDRSTLTDYERADATQMLLRELMRIGMEDLP